MSARLGVLVLLACGALCACAKEEAEPAAFVLPSFDTPPSGSVPFTITPVMPELPGTTPEIENPAAIAPLHAALARHGITRVSHLGDSSIGMDGLPHVLRTAFQSQFGDAGPGFVLLQPHSPNYRNRTVTLRNRTEWDELCFIIRRCLRDGHYGLGGVSVSSRGGAVTTIVPRDERVVTRAELWYAGHPRGGNLLFRFGRGDSTRVSTRAPALEDRWHVLERDPGPHGVSVQASSGGVSRAYGVVLENEGPGVVWDTLSMIGAFTNRLLAHDEAHFASQLAHRNPDLVVLSFGGNDLRRVVGRHVDEEGLRDETERLLTRVRRGAPGAGCLVTGIINHQRSGPTEVDPAQVDLVIRAQRAAARSAGCAFYDTVAAMGGTGSYAAWRRRGLAASDGKHLSPAGRRVIGARLFEALMHAGATSATSRAGE